MKIFVTPTPENSSTQLFVVETCNFLDGRYSRHVQEGGLKLYYNITREDYQQDEYNNFRYKYDLLFKEK